MNCPVHLFDALCVQPQRPIAVENWPNTASCLAYLEGGGGAMICTMIGQQNRQPWRNVLSRRRELNRGIFCNFLCMYIIQHCFICRLSDSTVSENAGIEPRKVVSSALAVRRSSHSATSHPQAASHPRRELLTCCADTRLTSRLSISPRTQTHSSVRGDTNEFLATASRSAWSNIGSERMHSVVVET